MQFFFLFLESLGTPEMILIALVALIVFGPRKLPEIGRTIGKYTAEFKRASREFRDTFEREVQMAELEEKQNTVSAESKSEITEDFNAVENTIGRASRNRSAAISSDNQEATVTITENVPVALPEIRAAEQNDFAADVIQKEIHQTAKVVENTLPNSKREWL